ncbi:MAG: FHA domain-containing protein [Myxococcaceae bacterium]|nr:MAG: FHA domain-containing protein [Myxococcaceae bacterium]
MTEDPNRKTYRQFQCRDYLWDTYEQMSRELECSVDYLINEAMRHYARTQGKAQPGGAAPPQPMGRPGMPTGAPPSGRAGMGTGAPLPGMNGMRQPVPSPVGAPSMNGRPMGAYPNQAPAQRMPPMAQQRPPAPMAPPSGGVLMAVFEGQRYPITKDEFFIGRSNKSCDLIVKDPNVSRQHARIVRHQGQFWMVDMGSTNGIEYQGGRVDRRPIAEGDVFRICDHEIVFTYR